MQEHHIRTVRRARYYTDGGGADPLAESWIVLHGFTQLAGAFITYFADVATPDRLVVAPEALNRYYLNRESSGSAAEARVGATWMTREDRENEIADYVDFLDAVHVETSARAGRVTVLGFSQGVSTACRWLAQGHARVHRLVAWAGQLPPDVDVSVFRNLPGGLVLVVGSRDEYAKWIEDGHHVPQLDEAGVPYEVVTFEGGHRLDRETLKRIAGEG